MRHELHKEHFDRAQGFMELEGLAAVAEFTNALIASGTSQFYVEPIDGQPNRYFVRFSGGY